METLGLLGGTGDLGTALAVHYIKKYDSVLLGSRSKEKAQATVADIARAKFGGQGIADRLRPCLNQEVARLADVIIATLPHKSAVETISSLANDFRGHQLLVSAVAPMERSADEFRSAPTSGETPITRQIEKVLPNCVGLATAFQTIPALVLYKSKKMDADVFVCCEKNLYQSVAQLVYNIEGLRPLYVGSLEQSAEVEGLTAILLNIGSKNHLRSPAIKIVSF